MRAREDMKDITTQSRHITEARRKIQIGRVDCRTEKDSVCDRIDLG